MNARFVTLWISLVLALGVSCKLGPDKDNDAERPIIDRVTANPSSVPVNETTTITGEARDPQGEDLTYVWTKEAGNFMDADLTGPVVHWEAPSTPGTYDVTLRVTNESGKSATKSVAISVTQTANPVITFVSPSNGAYIASTSGPVTISGTATPADSIHLLIENSLMNRWIGPTTFNWSWPISQENGLRTITIRAWRKLGVINYSSESTISVSIEGTIQKSK